MISQLKLKFGRTPGSSSTPIDLTPMTIFVGPNNSGKSKVLAEIQSFCSSGQKNGAAVILDTLSFVGSSKSDAEQLIERYKQPPLHNEAVPVGHIPFGRRSRQHVQEARLLGILQAPQTDLHYFCRSFLGENTLILNGQGRMQLVNPQAMGDLQAAPQSSLQVLFRDDERRQEVRRILKDAFDKFFVIDPTGGGTLRIRLSNRAPSTAMEERGIHTEAVEFHRQAQSIDSASDGVKAFTGIITEVIAGDPKALLIDEPEAFLHPSLAALLGKEISTAAKASDKRVFVSTHSPAFVMGCIQSGVALNIVRLTYRGGVPTARLLPSAEILELMRNPLLRSTGVLSGLFYEFVVVTESDTDRAFYQEINERLLQFKPEWGIPNCLFINAQNKQTIPTITAPLRKIGIPAVGIVDIDVLKEGGTVWAKFPEGACIPESLRQNLANLRTQVKKAADQTGKDMKKHGGTNIFDANDRAAVDSLFDQLAEYGFFTVRGGELESWLKGQGATGHGPEWLINIFEKMGEDPNLATYLRPFDDDVWAFIAKVRAWLMNPHRKGIPA